MTTAWNTRERARRALVGAEALARSAAGGVGGAEAGGAILMIMLPKVLLVVLS